MFYLLETDSKKGNYHDEQSRLSQPRSMGGCETGRKEEEAEETLGESRGKGRLRGKG